VPELEFTIDTTTGEFTMQIEGVAGPACEGVATLVKDLAGEPDREQRTAEYHLRQRVQGRSAARVHTRRA
jgi:hypothetical protein